MKILFKTNLVLLVFVYSLFAWEFMHVPGDTNSFSNIVEAEYCKSQIVVAGHSIGTIAGSANYSYFPPMPFDTNHIETRIVIDTIIKGSFKDTLSVFCGTGSQIIYNFKNVHFPSYMLNKDEKYVLFLRKDTLATIQIGKPIFYFYFSSGMHNLTEILTLCDNAKYNNCKNNVKPVYEIITNDNIKHNNEIKKKEKP
jgi:hypothetical protein